jgi:hypothetical protein
MAARKKDEAKPEVVRKSVTLEAAKLARAREVLDLDSDAEVIRLALDHLLSHFVEHHEEEE